MKHPCRYLAARSLSQSASAFVNGQDSNSNQSEAPERLVMEINSHYLTSPSGSQDRGKVSRLEPKFLQGCNYKTPSTTSRKCRHGIATTNSQHSCSPQAVRNQH